jgi:hypothetical protein
MSSPAVRGACLCGEVRFEAELPPLWFSHCHCESCRRAHGAGVVTFAGFPSECFRLTAGAERVGRYRQENGTTRSFCSTCGSTFLCEGPRWPGESHVAVGTLLDSLDGLPAGHAYADRSPDWCPITDDLPQYGGESGVEPLGAR